MQNAQLIFQQAGLKSTTSRLKVASVLAQSDYPLTHQDLLKLLPESFDRVTLYRVLDWLLQNKVIHRIAGEDRAWRFQINATSTGGSNNIQYSNPTTASKSKRLKQHSHAHFQCGSCGKVFCLENVHPKLTDTIPVDFVIDSIELNIKGTCSSCQK